MNTETVISILRAHRDELTRAGLVSLSVFGSVARGEAGPESDVDIAARIDPAARLDLLDLIGLERQISEWLGRKVDLVPEPVRKPRVQASIDRDRVSAY